MPTLTVDGATLQYLDQGRGLPVVLLHAFPLTAEAFRPQVDALSRRYRLIVPDHRGFGRSRGTGGPTEMSRLAKDAFAILDALKIPSAVFGGVSMGGYAAMAAVREDAGRVKALMLLDTQAGADDEAKKAQREQQAQAVEKDGMRVLLEQVAPKLLSPEALPVLRAHVETMIRMNPKEGAAAALRGMAMRPDAKELLARYAGPALVLVGERDELTPPPLAKAMAELIKGSQFVQVPSAGHLANLEEVTIVNMALDAFLMKVAA